MLARIRFRFVLLPKVNADEELWTVCALSVDGLGVPLRRFRKSHHFVPASSDRDARKHRGEQPAASRMPPRVGISRAYRSYPYFGIGKVETECPSSKASSIPEAIL